MSLKPSNFHLPQGKEAITPLLSFLRQVWSSISLGLYYLPDIIINTLAPEQSVLFLMIRLLLCNWLLTLAKSLSAISERRNSNSH
jgi:hypothetical protein